ncbi:MAG: YfiM family protein [Flavobacteriaceae bacterium]|nr:YfiM family protein [Flavobacteriaceae bacterium]
MSFKLSFFYTIKKYVFTLFLLFHLINYAQSKPLFFQKSDTLNKSRRNAIYITEAAGASIALIGLNQLWYADYPRSKFHFFNDNSSWMQMDKFGHAYSSYLIGKMGMDVLAWAGESKKNQLIYGATLGFVFLTTIEVFDGFSEEWGFSTGDVIANALGTGLLIGQELLWNEQRIQYKYSFSTSPYAQNNPDKLGENTLQQILKDYNGQTYWFSVNLWSFFKESNIPKWLNIAIGYGANGLPENSYDFSSRPIQQIESYRQFFTSIDIDLTKIRTNSPFLKTVFNLFNYVKIPAPTIEYRSNGQFKFHTIYF